MWSSIRNNFDVSSNRTLLSPPIIGPEHKTHQDRDEHDLDLGEGQEITFRKQFRLAAEDGGVCLPHVFPYLISVAQLKLLVFGFSILMAMSRMKPNSTLSFPLHTSVAERCFTTGVTIQDRMVLNIKTTKKN